MAMDSDTFSDSCFVVKYKLLLVEFLLGLSSVLIFLAFTEDCSVYFVSFFYVYLIKLVIYINHYLID